jgi:hypothetical protein
MTKPIVRIHNSQTDEIIDREMTDDEYAAHLENSAKYETWKANKAAKVTAKTALLAKLGISADEAALLLE